ncbi:hypothetical protein OQJ19_06200 [Fluoribacter gormanii]|uniref:Methyltransferase domain n=1 Tax=Fluoribacter gormanii TaxID=464 RepID=A0A377GF20_9GAMM|nr:hypothetical protein [Fluoribacter gormanii]KTD04595.1 hypothetical protein Lgor_0959 [Fluoribacter gormanii]MCW8470245.1 hypothetical protein [Fluoribacter gormanii]SIR32896.1 hypothetical protein SAMN05421777_11070 [Fluoribacter gormanii]STO23399.1 Uncharacterised protein [Fluoribacter gormanii]
MSRINLFEFEDFNFIPVLLRNATTDCLSSYHRLWRVYNIIYPDIVALLEKNDLTQIVDLCSGGTGTIAPLVTYIERYNLSKPVTITLTDLYPNASAFQLISKQHSNVHYIDQSIDATNVPDNLIGMRTIFTAFHHMSREKAKAILKNTIDCNMPIGIFEMTERSCLGLLQMIIGGPIVCIALLPFSRPRSLKKFLISPLAIFMTWWDGIASCLRTYSVDELNAMVKEVDPSGVYEWKIGKKFSLQALSYVTYLLGSKKLNHRILIQGNLGCDDEFL